VYCVCGMCDVYMSVQGSMDGKCEYVCGGKSYRYTDVLKTHTSIKNEIQMLKAA